MHGRLLATATAALCFVVAAPVQADSGLLEVQSMDFEGGAAVAGGLDLFYLADAFVETETPLPGGNEPSPSTPWIELHAGRAEAWSFSRTLARGPPGTASYPVDEPPALLQKLNGLDLKLSGKQAGFQVHVFPQGPGLEFEANANSGHLVTMEPPVMAAGTWGSNQQPVGESVSANRDDFALVERPGPLLQTQITGGGFEMTVHGDVVLELYRITLQGSSAEGEQTFVSGLFTRPLDSTLPAQTTAAASFEERRFVRMFLYDATLTVAAQDGQPEVHWAASTMASEHSGPVTLAGVVGTVHSQDEEPVELAGGFHVLAPGARLSMTPGSDAVSLAVRDPASNTQSTAATLASPQSATLVAVGAVLALVAAIGVGLLRNANRTPPLHEVESAIEAGRFRRAASMARRVLRASPKSEDALLARAIALSKGGRGERAIREIHQHIAARGATDGSLHYVLGVTYLDIGRRDEGRVALQEAARLTPSLAYDVSAKLGLEPSPQRTPVMVPETHGYA